MSEGTGISLGGDFGKAANTLIRKLADAAGALYQPTHIKRIAKAEVAADLIRVEGEIAKDEIYRRAAQRFVGEEVKKQENVEAVLNRTIPLLNDDAPVDKVDNDWVTNFTEKAKFVSTEEMRELLAKILAGESNSPGSFSKRTVNLVNDLDKADLQLFRRVCEFCWHIGGLQPVIFDLNHVVYQERGINFGALTHLDATGLLSFNSLSGFIKKGATSQFQISYAGQTVSVEVSGDAAVEFPVGMVLLSKAGQELAAVIDAPSDLEARDAVIEYWRTKSFKVNLVTG